MSGMVCKDSLPLWAEKPRTCPICGLGPCQQKIKKNQADGVVLVSFKQEDIDFLLDNCDKNTAFGLTALSSLTSRDLIERTVAMLESFKSVKRALKAAVKDL